MSRESRNYELFAFSSPACCTPSYRHSCRSGCAEIRVSWDAKRNATVRTGLRPAGIRPRLLFPATATRTAVRPEGARSIQPGATPLDRDVNYMSSPEGAAQQSTREAYPRFLRDAARRIAEPRIHRIGTRGCRRRTSPVGLRPPPPSGRGTKSKTPGHARGMVSMHSLERGSRKNIPCAVDACRVAPSPLEGTKNSPRRGSIHIARGNAPGPGRQLHVQP